MNDTIELKAQRTFGEVLGKIKVDLTSGDTRKIRGAIPHGVQQWRMSHRWRIGFREFFSCELVAEDLRTNLNTGGWKAC